MMKLSMAMLTLALVVPAHAQTTVKLAEEITKVDQAELAAVLANDVSALEKYWAEDLTVNAPNNQVLKGRKDALELVRTGILDYAVFEREIEAVLTHGDTVIVMGLETVKPRGKAPFAGQTLRRRCTNIWMKRNGQWQLTARHASIVPQNLEPAADTGQLSSADESAVRSVVSEFARTWNRHDMKVMHELNTADVEWINVTANHWRGNAAVFKGHDTIHRTVFAKTEMSVDQTLVRAVAPNVAMAVATMKFGPVVMPSGEVMAELRTRGSFTMVKDGGRWKISHFQNTNIDAEAEKNDPLTWDETGFLPGRK